MNLHLTVNGVAHEVAIVPTERLLDVLRDRLGLTGTKEGCAEGECGACTAIVDGLALNSCLMLAAQAEGRSVTTIEGLSAAGGLDALQSEFIERGAVQCGFCTPGMLMSATALLRTQPDPTPTDVRAALAGNLCRCTGYSAILDAVASVAARAVEQPGD